MKAWIFVGLLVILARADAGVFDKGFGRDDYHEGNSYGKSQKTYYCCDGSSCQETNEHKLGCQLTRSVCEWLCGGNFAEKHYCCNKGNYICEEKSHGGANCYNDREKCNSECKDDTPKEFFYCCIEKNGSKQCVKEDSNIPGGNCQKTKTGCENVCKDRCSLPADAGPCEAAIRSWFYNYKTGQCEEFIYGGCEGNENRFDTEKACEATCGAPPVDVCTLPVDPGPCKGSFPSWFYNYKTGQCEEFIYGGCGGNENRFGTEKDCEAACGSPPVDVCTLSADPGPCRALIPRWFYNSKTGYCEEFNYGGCQGNGNRFDTKEECETAC